MKRGDRIGECFLLARQIGKGGMGEVWLAEDLGLKRKVAIKFFTAPFGDQKKLEERFLREAKVVARLQSPHIVTVHGYEIAKKTPPYIIMEWVNGESLQTRLAREKRIDVKTTVHVAMQVALALEAAQQEGIVHRDLKPENVLICSLAGDPWFVKVVDFGLARSYEDEDQHDLGRLTTASVVLGTPAYMSPEQAMGKKLEAPSDLYSLGVMMYRMLAGRTPIKAASAQEYLVAHQIQPPAPLQEQKACADLPTDLVQLIMSLLEKRPEARPSTPAVVSDYLRTILRNMTSHRDGPVQVEETEPAEEIVEEAKEEVSIPEPEINWGVDPKESANKEMGNLDTMVIPPSFDASDSILSQPALIPKHFLGRSAELEQLDEHFQHVIQNSISRCVVVRGPSGVGISRLLVQFLALTRKKNPKTHTIRLYPWSGPVDLFGRPFSELLLRATKLDTTASSEELKARFGQAVKKLVSAGFVGSPEEQVHLIRRSAAALAALSGAEQRSHINAMAPEQVMDDVLEFSSRFLRGVFKDAPTVLSIDRAELLRPGAVRLLSAWLDRIRPGRWLVILGMRNDAPARAKLRPKSNVGRFVIDVDPLPDKPSQEIIQHFATVLKNKDVDWDQVLETAQGRPGIIHSAAIDAMLGQPLSKYLETPGVFETTVLNAVAACGGPVPTDMIQSILGPTADSALRLWARHGVVVPCRVHELGGRQGYTFDSRRYFRAAPRIRDRFLRISIHDGAVAWLNTHTSNDSLATANRILEHHVGRGKLRDTLQIAERMATHALTIGAYSDASDAASRIVQALSTRAERSPLNQQDFTLYIRGVILTADVKSRIGQTMEAFEVLERAARLAQAYPVEQFGHHLAELLTVRAELTGTEQERDTFIQRAQTALAGVGDEALQETPQRSVALLIRLAENKLHTDQSTAAEQLLHRADGLAQHSKDLDLQVQVVLAQSHAAQRRDNFVGAEQRLREAYETSESSHQKARLHLELGRLLGGMHRFEEALELVQNSRFEFERLSEMPHAYEAILIEAELLLARPDAWAAHRVLTKTIIDPSTQPGTEARRLELLAQTNNIIGEPDQASRCAKKAIQLALSIADKKTALRAKLTLVKTKSQKHADGRAIHRELNALIEHQRTLQDLEGLARTYYFLAEEAVRGNLPGVARTAAAEMIDQAARLFRKVGLNGEVKRVEEFQHRNGL